MPQWFSMAPRTRLMATMPLRGYSEIDTKSWICEVVVAEGVVMRR
jgi:hypothetical protein